LDTGGGGYDPEQVRQWLRLLHGHADGLTHICCTGDWAGATFTDLDQATNHVTGWHRQGREGIYARVTTLKAPLAPGRRGGAADTASLPALWADLDLAGPGHQHDPAQHGGHHLPPDEAAARMLLAASGLPVPTLWVHSGGGLYPIWLLAQPVAVDDRNRAQIAQLAALWQHVIATAAERAGWHYGTGVGDLARVLRIPGTVNRKAGQARPCRILDHTGPRHTLQQLHDALTAGLRTLPPTSPPPVSHTITLTPAGPAGPRSDSDPGEDLNRRGSWPQILQPAGWSLAYERDAVQFWTRPGKTTGVSATVNALGTDRLYCFTTNGSPFTAGQSYNKHAAYTLLNHGGDFRAATRELARAGYGGPLPDAQRQAQDNMAAILGTPEPPSPSVATVTGRGPASRYFTDGGALLAQVLATEVIAQWPCALTREQRVAIYRNGVYRLDTLALSAAVAECLGDRFTPKHRATVTEFIAGRLYTIEQILPEQSRNPLLNVRNGMLNIITGDLTPHDPVHLSAIQIPVTWNPDATCPRYEQWVNDRVPQQVEDLEETISTMLDPSRTPTRALFAFGPSRSGKSTFLRIAAAVAGIQNVSAVTLHQLTDNRFAAANVYGKILNSAADISSSHVEDISIFKMLTGEDPIHADRKYGGQFTFTNRALFAFSANTLPTIGDSSRAYVERIKPFAFSSSFAGHENPEIEIAIMSELPGILVRWVKAYQRLLARGRRLPTPPDVWQEFEERSDRVRQWVADRCEITGGVAVSPGSVLPPTEVSSQRMLARAFNHWAREQGGSAMGERKIVDRLTSIDGIVQVRSSFDKSRGLNLRAVIDTTYSDLLGDRS
jgi:P4 family phage/plasmid primase-like protien